MAKQLPLNDRPVWLKRFGIQRRPFRLGLLDSLARDLANEALRPAPHLLVIRC